MAHLRDVLKRDFNIDEARLSPHLRECLERLDKLEDDAELFGRYMDAPLENRAGLSISDDLNRLAPELIEPERPALGRAENDVEPADETLAGGDGLWGRF